MRSIAAALALVTALGCRKHDDTQASSSVPPPGAAVAIPSGAPSGAPALVSLEPRANAARGAPSGAGVPAEREGASADRASGAAAERGAERHALVARLRQDGITNERVLSAMDRVPRHAFVPDDQKARAYVNEPLPIGYGQTISQPIVVAAMTEAAAPDPEDKCLEIGTGSGYQAAVLAELCAKVYSIEYLEPLARAAERNLRRAGYGEERVALRTGDGYRGWPGAGPFDVVLVTAAPESVPQPLLDQLAPGGRLVIPVGPRSGAQQLELWVRSNDPDGRFTRTPLMNVRFVPFVGEADKNRR